MTKRLWHVSMKLMKVIHHFLGRISAGGSSNPYTLAAIPGMRWCIGTIGEHCKWYWILTHAPSLNPKIRWSIPRSCLCVPYPKLASFPLGWGQLAATLQGFFVRDVPTIVINPNIPWNNLPLIEKPYRNFYAERWPDPDLPALNGILIVSPGGSPRIDGLNGSIESLRHDLRTARGVETHEDHTCQWLFRGPSDWVSQTRWDAAGRWLSWNAGGTALTLGSWSCARNLQSIFWVATEQRFFDL